jgi:UDP-glucose 4-epimerase
MVCLKAAFMKIQKTSLRNLFDQRILVTGASGFIGSHLCRRLLSEGAEIFAVSRTIPSKDEAGFHWFQGDLTEFIATRELIHRIRPSVVFHLAGITLGHRNLEAVLPTFHNNLITTVNLLTALGEVGCQRVLLAGSLEEPEQSKQFAVPSSPYAASKWAGSLYGRMFHSLFSLPVTVLRIFMTYGPEQRDVNKLIPYVILSLLHGKVPELTSGRRLIDWVYIQDVVDGFIAAAQADNIEGCTVDIGTGKLVSIKAVVEQIIQITHSEIEPHFGAVPDRLMEQERVADVLLSNILINWKPSVSLEEGLKLTVEWYRAHQ